MRLTRLLATTAIASIAAAPAFADIRPVVNTFTELAHDLRGVTFAADGKVYASGHIGANETASTVVAQSRSRSASGDTQLRSSRTSPSAERSSIR